MHQLSEVLSIKRERPEENHYRPQDRVAEVLQLFFVHILNVSISMPKKVDFEVCYYETTESSLELGLP
jgi:hypothetical protein